MPLYGIGRRWLLLVSASCVLVFLFVLFTPTHNDIGVVENPVVLPEKVLPGKVDKPVALSKPEPPPKQESPKPEPPAPVVLTGSHPVPQLSPDYTAVLDTQSAFCKDRFDVPYLEKLRDSAVEYCATGSSSQVTCFHSTTTDDLRVDSFCLASGAVYEGNALKYRLGCEMGELPTEAANIPYVPTLNELQMYWYETGPGVVFKSIKVDEGFKPALPAPRVPQYTLLVKREGATNVWHCLMELFAMTLSMDVLRMAQKAGTETPYLTPGDEDHTQVVLLDDAEDGPFFGLWSLFSKRPVLRLKELPSGTQLENVIVPLAGASNPMWQGDWVVHSCEHSRLLQTFSRRVLGFHNLEPHKAQKNSQVVVTYINRTGSRRLVHGEEYFNRVASKYPHVKVQSVDMAGLSLQKQLELIQGTDVLVGVHGAGLTHGMFLPPSSAMVELLPHKLDHKGFRNMASLMDHEYFTIHASGATAAKRDDWHSNDVYIEEERFMETIDAAVKVMYNRGERNYDIN